MSSNEKEEERITRWHMCRARRVNSVRSNFENSKIQKSDVAVFANFCSSITRIHLLVTVQDKWLAYRASSVLIISIAL